MVTLSQQGIRIHVGYLFVFNSFQICQCRVIIVIGIDGIAIIIRFHYTQQQFALDRPDAQNEVTLYRGCSSLSSL